MKKRRISRKKAILATSIILLALVLVGIGLLLIGGRAGAPKAKTVATKPTPTVVTAPAVTTPATPPAPFNKAEYSTTDASSLWVVVNKQHPLQPIDYAPSDLVSAYGRQVSSRMVPDLTAMINAAANDKAYITLVSTYRSYPYQVNLYNSYTAADGQDKADTYSARPGYSEHQTGLAIDFGDRAGTCSVQDCYADTPEGKWLAANAYKYGFLLRYTADKQSVTGYEAEAWHYRYVGRDLTLEMHTEGVTTLEEFFGITGGEQYAQ